MNNLIYLYEDVSKSKLCSLYEDYNCAHVSGTNIDNICDVIGNTLRYSEGKAIVALSENYSDLKPVLENIDRRVRVIEVVTAAPANGQAGATPVNGGQPAAGAQGNTNTQNNPNAQGNPVNQQTQQNNAPAKKMVVFFGTDYNLLTGQSGAAYQALRKAISSGSKIIQHLATQNYTKDNIDAYLADFSLDLGENRLLNSTQLTIAAGMDKLFNGIVTPEVARDNSMTRSPSIIGFRRNGGAVINPAYDYAFICPPNQVNLFKEKLTVNGKAPLDLNEIAGNPFSSSAPAPDMKTIVDIIKVMMKDWKAGKYINSETCQFIQRGDDVDKNQDKKAGAATTEGKKPRVTFPDIKEGALRYAACIQSSIEHPPMKDDLADAGGDPAAAAKLVDDRSKQILEGLMKISGLKELWGGVSKVMSDTLLTQTVDIAKGIAHMMKPGDKKGEKDSEKTKAAIEKMCKDAKDNFAMYVPFHPKCNEYYKALGLQVSEVNK